MEKSSLVFEKPVFLTGFLFNTDLVKNADLMWKQSVWTSVIASSVGAHHLKEGGMLVLTGAQTALKATAGRL